MLCTSVIPPLSLTYAYVYRRRFVQYCMSIILALRKAGMVPVVILDGGHLPAKAQEALSRKECVWRGFEGRRDNLPFHCVVSVPVRATDMYRHCTYFISGRGSPA